MKTKLFHIATVALLLLSLGACNDGKTICDETITFEKNTWNRFKPEQIDFDVKNVEDYYNIDLTVQIDTAVYRYDEFPIMVILTNEYGEERQFFHEIKMKENNRWRGEQEGKLRAIKGRVRSYFTFNHVGEQKMRISQFTSQFDLEGIHSIQLEIEKAKLDI